MFPPAASQKEREVAVAARATLTTNPTAAAGPLHAPMMAATNDAVPSPAITPAVAHWFRLIPQPFGPKLQVEVAEHEGNVAGAPPQRPPVHE